MRLLDWDTYPLSGFFIELTWECVLQKMSYTALRVLKSCPRPQMMAKKCALNLQNILQWLLCKHLSMHKSWVRFRVLGFYNCVLDTLWWIWHGIKKNFSWFFSSPYLILDVFLVKDRSKFIRYYGIIEKIASKNGSKASLFFTKGKNSTLFHIDLKNFVLTLIMN